MTHRAPHSHATAQALADVPGHIRTAFADVPEAGHVMQVADGVYWLHMPLPFALDRINLWLLEDGDGWTVVDCGLSTGKSRQIWEDVFESVLDGRPISRVLVTHFHPDHIGLAGWLCRRWEAPLWISRTEWLFARMLLNETSESWTEHHVDFLRRAGCPDAFVEQVREHGHGYAPVVTRVPEGFKRISHGDEIEIGPRKWRVMVGHGHAPEHACLYSPDLGVLISGDQILPRISPNIGVYANEPDADPLSEFLASLTPFEDLPDETLVLPSHREPFFGLAARVGQIADHHAGRLTHLARIMSRPVTAMEATAALFTREFHSQELGFALAETIAHINFLSVRGLIDRSENENGQLVQSLARPFDAAALVTAARAGMA